MHSTRNRKRPMASIFAAYMSKPPSPENGVNSTSYPNRVRSSATISSNCRGEIAQNSRGLRRNRSRSSQFVFSTATTSFEGIEALDDNGFPAESTIPEYSNPCSESRSCCHVSNCSRMVLFAIFAKRGLPAVDSHSKRPTSGSVFAALRRALRIA